MAELFVFSSQGKSPSGSPRQKSQGEDAPSKKPRIKVGLFDDAGDVTTTLVFEGRNAWALNQLISAGQRGCTPIDNPAPRWSHYVYKLRRGGIDVETIHEAHGGQFAGHHARYVLRSKLRVLEVHDPQRQGVTVAADKVPELIEALRQVCILGVVGDAA